MRIGTILFVILCIVAPVFPALKPHYGGNAKIAEDLSAGIMQIRLFENQQDALKSSYPLRFSIQENILRVDLSGWPADKITELEKAIDILQDEKNACHWILDYPYLSHNHQNSLKIEKDQLLLQTEEPEYLIPIAQSPCLIPQELSYLLPFVKTQFGYEVNQDCIAGRPFLDSISPVVVDPVNPYLGFKLNEVDAFSIPEEKFRQISNDEQIQAQPGPRYFLYLKSEAISPEQMISLASVFDLPEIARAVLNDHAEILLIKKETAAPPALNSPLYLKIPEEIPFRLVGERLRIQLENARFTISKKALPKKSPTLELAVAAINEPDFDLFRYRLMRNPLGVSSDLSWFEEWDNLEAAGKILPLMLYESRIAVRKNMIDVQSGLGGFPDFSEAWILPAP